MELTQLGEVSFYGTQGIVLGHCISKKGFEVDKAAKILISKLPSPETVKEICSFLGHVSFYICFIRNFSQIFKSLCGLLENDRKFVLAQECLIAFEILKTTLSSTLIMTESNQTKPFELKCDVFDIAIRAMLKQKRDNIIHPIYHANNTLNEAHINYTTSEKELLAVVFVFVKFKSYLVGTKVIVHNDHFALKFLLSKNDAKPRSIGWILLLQEFDLEIQDRKYTKNQVAYHMSKLEFKGLNPNRSN